MRLKVQVIDADGQILGGNELDSQDGVDAWVAQGKSEGWYPTAAEWVVTDITAAFEQSESDRVAIDRGLAKQMVGAKAVAMLNQVHEEMNLDVQGLTALVADQRLMMAVTLVRNGAIIIGRDMFLSVAAQHYSAEQIARIVRPINESEFNVAAPT